MKNTEELKYGVASQKQSFNHLDDVIEDLETLGFSVLCSNFSSDQVEGYARIFDQAHERYLRTYGGKEHLDKISEGDQIRLPLCFDPLLAQIAVNDRVLHVCRKMIAPYVILNQQNGVINSGSLYSQARWHRDLPYQHFITSRPIAISALYCVDDFTEDNGATLVLPASHKQEVCPSDSFIKRNTRKVIAKAGSYILINSMLYHSGGINTTGKARRAVNHVYTIPIIKQQIDIPNSIIVEKVYSEIQELISMEEFEELMGYSSSVPEDVTGYLKKRFVKKENHFSG